MIGNAAVRSLARQHELTPPALVPGCDRTHQPWAPIVTLMLASPGPCAILMLTSPGPHASLVLTSPGPYAITFWQAAALWALNVSWVVALFIYLGWMHSVLRFTKS